MSLESGKKSAAEMRAAQRDMISKAEAVQPTVAVMEPNWKAMIESQKAQVDTLGKILEKLGTLTTEERFLAQLEMQLQVFQMLLFIGILVLVMHGCILAALQNINYL